MNDISDIKSKANELRKNGDYESALILYEELWKNSNDKFDAAGLLFCYRKLKLFDKAIPFSEEVISKFPDFNWCKNEFIWTQIQGKLYTFPDEGELSEMFKIVNHILEMKPDEIAYKITIFKLLKCAKKNGDWNSLNEWIIKIDPKILDGYTDESTGWTDKELWYYYRVHGLINISKEEEAIKIIDDNRDEYYKQSKFFDRLKAKAYISLKLFDKSEGLYKTLISKHQDWWLLHEYGCVLLSLNKVDEALKYLVIAALHPPMKLELKITLLSDIANLLIKLGKKEQALLHLLLIKAVREENNWSIGDLNEKISSLQVKIDVNNDIKLLLKDCKIIWQDYSGNNSLSSVSSLKEKNLKGKIINLTEGKPFCFIKTNDNQSYFCSKNDLPENACNEQLVSFDIKPSFDKKKNKQTFKAINITVIK